MEPFLLVPEMTGTYAYLAANPGRRALTVAALNLDIVGADQAKGGGPLCIEQPPMAAPTFVDRYAYSLLDSLARDVKNFSGTFSYSTCHYLQTRFSGGSDHYILSDPSIGIPCPMMIQWPDKHYHTSLDHPGNLDPKMMKRVASVASLYAWGLADGKEEEWVDFLVSDVAKRGDYLRSVMEWALKGSLLGGRGPEVLAFYREYENKALDALAAYGEIRGFEKLTAEVAWAREHLQAACETLHSWVQKKVKAAGSAEPSRPVLDAEAAARVYARTWDGPSHLMGELAKLPAKRRMEWARYQKEAKIRSGYDTFLEYRLDGRSTLGEILEAVLLETGAWHPEFALRYLELCRELGAVNLISRSNQGRSPSTPVF